MNKTILKTAAAATLLTACIPGTLADLGTGRPPRGETTPPPSEGQPQAPPAEPETIRTEAPGPVVAVMLTIEAGGVAITAGGKPKHTLYLNRHPRLSATPVLPSRAQLDASVRLSDGTQTRQALWHSSRPDTAYVDAGGLVTAGGATGSADIVATSQDGRVAATAAVMVTDDGVAEVVVD